MVSVGSGCATVVRCSHPDGEAEASPAMVPGQSGRWYWCRYWPTGTASGPNGRSDAVDPAEHPDRGPPRPSVRFPTSRCDPSDPVHRPGTVALAAACTRHPGWTYAPAPSAHAASRAHPRAAPAEPSASASRRAERVGRRRAHRLRPRSGTVVEISAELEHRVRPDRRRVPRPIRPSMIHFANNDAASPTTSTITGRRPGRESSTGDIFTGVETRTYDVPAAGGRRSTSSSAPSIRT